MASDEVCIIWKPLPRVRRARRPLLLQENQAPENILLPEAVNGNMDVKHGLVGLAQPAMGEPSGEREEGIREPQQGELGIHLDPETLSYVDKLFSQEDLLNKVDEILQSRFVTQLLSEDSHLDLLALTKELLELEEALALVWLLEKLRLAEEEKEEEEENEIELAPQSDGALQYDFGPSESVASQGAQGDDYGPQQEVNINACPPDDFKDGQGPGHVDAQLAMPQAFAGPSESQECPPALGPPSAPQGLEHIDSGLGPRDAAIPRQIASVRGRRRRPVGKSSEKEGLLPGQVYPVVSLRSLPPSALSLSPVPASDLACPRGRGARRAAQSRPPKRKCEQSVAGRGRKMKRYSSQRGAVGGLSCPQSGGPQ